MSVDVIRFSDWVFKDDENEQNRFFNSILVNRLKSDGKLKPRSIDELNNLDCDYIKKNLGKKSENSISELKSEVKTAYLSKRFNLRMIDWFIVKPLNKSGLDDFKTIIPLYLPLSETIGEIKRYLINKSLPCFDYDYLSVTDMTDGSEDIIFIGGLDEPEPPCTGGFDDHEWNWLVYHNDGKEVYEAECTHCKLRRSMVLGDTRAYRWNDNHGWRYFR